MTALTWAIRLIIFIFLVVFAAQNTYLVNLRLFPGATWEVPLVIALLAFFVGGVMLGALSLLGMVFQQRREISQLRRIAGQSVSSEKAPPNV